jgi:hypothetical protein
MLNGLGNIPSMHIVRNIIDSIPIESSNDVVFQNAFRYLLLGATRLIEITGDYAPIGNDAHRVEINGFPALLIVQQTARRKGKVRPIALPLDPKNEPWAEPVASFFQEHPTENPFILPSAPKSTRRYLQYKSDKVFKGLQWPVEQYSKTVYEPTNANKIIKERLQLGKTEYLVEYPDEERHWVKDPYVKKGTVIREAENKPFSLQSLRHLRIRELKRFYQFSDDEIKQYTGLTRVGRDSPTSRTLDRYRYLDPLEGASNVEALVNVAGGYFDKLLKTKT